MPIMDTKKMYIVRYTRTTDEPWDNEQEHEVLCKTEDEVTALLGTNINNKHFRLRDIVQVDYGSQKVNEFTVIMRDLNLMIVPVDAVTKPEHFSGL